MPFRKMKQKVLYEGSRLRLSIGVGRCRSTVRQTRFCVQKNDLSDLGQLLNQEIKGAICLRMDDVYFLDTLTATVLIGFLRIANCSNTIVEVWGASPYIS